VLETHAAGRCRMNDSVTGDDELKIKDIRTKFEGVLDIDKYNLRCKNKVQIIRDGGNVSTV
jgi:hypothetical protein